MIDVQGERRFVAKKDTPQAYSFCTHEDDFVITIRGHLYDLLQLSVGLDTHGATMWDCGSPGKTEVAHIAICVQRLLNPGTDSQEEGEDGCPASG